MQITPPSLNTLNVKPLQFSSDSLEIGTARQAFKLKLTTAHTNTPSNDIETSVAYNIPSRSAFFNPLARYLNRKHPSGSVAVDGGGMGLDRLFFRLSDTSHRLVPNAPKPDEIDKATIESTTQHPIVLTRDISPLRLQQILNEKQMHPAFLKTIEGDEPKLQAVMRQVFQQRGTRFKLTDLFWKSLGPFQQANVVTAPQRPQQTHATICRGLIWQLKPEERRAYLSKTANEQPSGGLFVIGDKDLMDQTTPSVIADLKAAGYRPSQSPESREYPRYMAKKIAAKPCSAATDPRRYYDEGIGYIWVKQ